MGNRVNVQYSKFQNLDCDGNILTETFGFRIYDDYGQGYNNTFDSFGDLKDYLNEDTLLDVIHEIKGFDDIDQTSCRGVSFNGNYFTWKGDKLALPDDEDSKCSGCGHSTAVCICERVE